MENTWTYSDIFQIVIAVILFILGVVISNKQEKSINLSKELITEVKYLQTGLAELQMYEKIGVLGWGLNRAKEDASAAPALLYDCIALLPVLEFSRADLVERYVNLYLRCLESLTDNYSVEKIPLPVILIDYSLKQIAVFQSRNQEDIADEITNAIARYLDFLKNKDEKKAEEICSKFLQPERARDLLRIEKGNTVRIMKLLRAVALSIPSKSTNNK